MSLFDSTGTKSTISLPTKRPKPGITAECVGVQFLFAYAHPGFGCHHVDCQVRFSSGMATGLGVRTTTSLLLAMICCR